jgi:glycosyltransferase involved in cell wall biosynthesis
MSILARSTGFLLPPGDEQSWAAKINEIARWSPQVRLAFTRQARARAKAHFNWQRVAQATLVAYGR